MDNSIDPASILSSSHRALLQMAYGAQTSQAIYVAAKLGIADLLKDRSRSAVEIADVSGANASTLRRLLRFLVCRGVCAELPGDRFSLTELGQLLQSDRSDSIRHRAIFNAEVLFPLWGELLQTITTGASAAQRVFGMPLYEHLAQHPEIRALFDRTMADGARYRHGPAIAAYDFSQFRTIVDVGGSNGALLISILKGCPHAQGMLFDLPAAAERARQNIEAAGLADRCSAIGGNAFERVPEGGNVYILSNFLIDMDDTKARTILLHCHNAMANDARLLLIEWVIPPVEEKLDSYRSWDTTSMDLIMLSIGGARGGRVRTADEFRNLLESADFVPKQFISTDAAVSLIEAVPKSVTAS